MATLGSCMLSPKHAQMQFSVVFLLTPRQAPRCVTNQPRYQNAVPSAVFTCKRSRRGSMLHVASTTTTTLRFALVQSCLDSAWLDPQVTTSVRLTRQHLIHSVRVLNLALTLMAGSRTMSHQRSLDSSALYSVQQLCRTRSSSSECSTTTLCPSASTNAKMVSTRYSPECFRGTQ